VYSENERLKSEQMDMSDLVNKARNYKHDNTDLRTSLDRLRSKYETLKMEFSKVD